MEENKHYTPEIEEFHVGFEFERASVDCNWIINEWNKEVVNTNTCLKIIEKHIGFQRVKYLDKEDVENMGWKSHKEIQHYYKSPCDNFILRIKYEGVCIYVYDEYTVDKLIFEGIIKNKTELKKLLKQLRI